MSNEKLIEAQDRDDAEAELRLRESDSRPLRKTVRSPSLSINSKAASSVPHSPFESVVVVDPCVGFEQKIRSESRTTRSPRKSISITGRCLRQGFRGNVHHGVAGHSREGMLYGEVQIGGSLASGTSVVLVELPNPKLEVPSGVKSNANFPGAQGK